MARLGTKITIVGIRTVPTHDLNEELQWMGNALGLFSERDKEKSCFRIFIELLRSTKHNNALTSDELALRLSLARGTVVHHLNKLMEAHLVGMNRKAYILRYAELERVIAEVEEDSRRLFNQMKVLAKIIDKKMDQP